MRGPGAEPHHLIICPLSPPLKEWSDEPLETPLWGTGAMEDASVVRQSPFTVIVLPGLTRNPVFLSWIPAFAGMTASE
jgi:hypothetical protein